jgi:hypothetical protein
MSSFYNYFKHSAIAFVKFMAEIADESREAAQAVVGAGFLDTLLQLCVLNFADMRDSFDDNCQVRERRKDLLDYIHGALKVLARHPTVQKSMKEHPLAVIWPRESFEKLAELGITSCAVEELPSLRKLVWLRLGQTSISSRLASIDDDILEHVGLHGSTSVLEDACLDLVEFTRWA